MGSNAQRGGVDTADPLLYVGGGYCPEGFNHHRSGDSRFLENLSHFGLEKHSARISKDSKQDPQTPRPLVEDSGLGEKPPVKGVKGIYICVCEHIHFIMQVFSRMSWCF